MNARYDFSMDARMVRVIAENLKRGHFLEVFIHGSDLLNVIDKTGWESTLSFGWVEWSDPYIIVKGARDKESEALYKEIVGILNRKGMEMDVIDEMM